MSWTNATRAAASCAGTTLHSMLMGSIWGNTSIKSKTIINRPVNKQQIKQASSNKSMESHKFCLHEKVRLEVPLYFHWGRQTNADGAKHTRQLEQESTTQWSNRFGRPPARLKWQMAKWMIPGWIRWRKTIGAPQRATLHLQSGWSSRRAEMACIVSDRGKRRMKLKKHKTTQTRINRPSPMSSYSDRNPNSYWIQLKKRCGELDVLAANNTKVHAMCSTIATYFVRNGASAVEWTICTRNAEK